MHGTMCLFRAAKASVTTAAAAAAAAAAARGGRGLEGTAQLWVLPTYK